MEKLQTLKDESGKFPAYAWSGGYPIIYIASDGDTFCPACANGENGSIARTVNGPDDDSRDGWLIVGADIHWEGPPEICCHCGKVIESAYGDPDAQEDN